MNGFDGFEQQDLGQDFVFESDPNSLQRILDNRELSPRSVLALRLSSKLIQPTLSPAKGAPKQIRDHPERYDFFESKKGNIFWRPKTPRAAKADLGSQQKAQRPQRALGRVAIFALPQRGNMQDKDPRTTMSSRKPTIDNKKDDKNKGRRSCMPNMMALPKLPPLRQSISERKAVPGLDLIPNRLPRQTKLPVPQVRKELNFDDDENKENDDDSSNFAKPLPPPAAFKEPVTQAEKKSLARMILTRESLAGLPRASLSGLFRQSLSVAELDRLFDDDSTQSFEDLEKRLKTPAKAKSSASRRTPFKAPPKQSEEVQQESPEKLELLENHLNTPTIVNTKPEEIPVPDMAETSEESESPLPQKTVSLTDLSSAIQDEMVKEEKLIPLAKSSSMIDLSSLKDLNPSSEFLKSALVALEEHRQEQAVIENQIQSLMKKSLERRQQFRAVWGVSPRSINQKRDLKTVINVQKVSFSKPDLEEAEDNDFAQMEEESQQMEEESQPVTSEEEEEEPPMNSDLFQQLIEANFPEQGNVSYAPHNFTGIDITLSDLTTSLDEVILGLQQQVNEASSELNTRAEDFNLETPEVPLSSAENTENVTKSILKGPRSNEMDLEEPTETLIYEEKSKKTVRFINATPQKTIRMDDSEDENATVTVNIGGFAFNESRMKNPIVHTPVPKHLNWKMSMEDAEMCEKTPPLPTPMAMRDISKRAHEALAALYLDNDRSSEELQPKTLFENDDDMILDD